MLVDIRPMTDEEMAQEGWSRLDKPPAVLEFADGTIVFASQDTEGNGPGILSGQAQDGTEFAITNPDAL